jgi:hypothetical protein
MVKLEKYIHDLLLDHETLIVPGFGAFILASKPAEISETEIKPPSRRLSFSSDIRNNDGLLVGYVANVEQISHFDALKIIEKERDNIVFLLDKGEEVIIEETGKEEQQTEEPELIAPTESIPADTDQLENSEKIIEETPDESEITSQITEAEPVEETVEKESDFGAKPEQPTVKVMTETVFVTVDKPEPEKENKRKVAWYWYLAILVFVIIAGIFVLRNVTEKKQVSTDSYKAAIQESTQSENQVKESPVIVPDSTGIVQEKVQQDSSISFQPEQSKEEEFAPGQPVYYLIGGSFKESEESAMAYMDELKEKGFKPFYMGKRGNFYTVGIGKYKTEGQAVRVRDTIWLKYPEWHLWVMQE